MKRNACLMLLALLAVSAVAGRAQDVPASVVLRYAPQVDAEQTSVVKAKLLDLQMNGASLGLTGLVEGVIKLQVIKVDPETGNFQVHSTFDVKKVEFASQPREPKPIQPALITFSPLGDVLKVERVGDDGEAAAGNPVADILGSGGLPLDAITLMAVGLRFSEEPVAAGGEWKVELEQELPLLGKAKIVKNNKLAKLENLKATIETSESADVPPFEMKNPLLEGTMKVESGKFQADKVVREFDIQTSFVSKAKGGFKIDLTADMGFGVPTPIAAIGEFELLPIPKPEEGEAAPQATDEAPAEPAQDTQPQPPDGQASRRSLKLGPMAAGAGYADGMVSVDLGVDMQGTKLPEALGKYALLLQALRASCAVDAGVTPETLGKIGVRGEVAVGPLALNRVAEVDLKQVSKTLLRNLIALLSHAKQ